MCIRDRYQRRVHGSRFRNTKPITATNLDEGYSTNNSSFENHHSLGDDVVPLRKAKTVDDQFMMDVLEEQQQIVQHSSGKLQKKQPLIKSDRTQFDSADYFMKLYKDKSKQGQEK
eukprot:TRINITY_DN4366_c0_g1_i2.p1 TRINITY_DN4366_c0_g1~~TRINITY_DN4366_c0_g1_i2.p1  ORF type:complete len:130 (+),score=28.58 TRINITY_DN4366_c0_g1_i2:47-391(+)